MYEFDYLKRSRYNKKVNKGVVWIVLFVIAFYMSADDSIVINHFELPNGLKVLFSPQKNTGAVSVCLYYMNGGRNDPPDMIGVSYFFKDLMFQGTANLEPFHHFFFVNLKGGSIGGRVTHDNAFFYQVLPDSELEIALRYESERLQSLKLKTADIETEKREILNRIARIDGNVITRANAWVLSSVLQGTVYERPVYGDSNRIRLFSPQRIIDFYKNFQNISNVLLVVTGHFNVNDLRKYISEHFQGIPGGYRAKSSFSVAPMQIQNSVHRNWAVENMNRPFCIYGFRAPARLSGDYFYFNFLRYYLGDSRFSRLDYIMNQVNALHVDIDISLSDYFESNALTVQLTAGNRRDLEKAKILFDSEIQALQKTLIAANDVRTVRNIMELDFLKRMSSLEEKALGIAEYYHMFAGTDFFPTYLNRIRKIDSYAILNVSKKYLRKDGRVLLNVYGR